MIINETKKILDSLARPGIGYKVPKGISTVGIDMYRVIWRRVFYVRAPKRQSIVYDAYKDVCAQNRMKEYMDRVHNESKKRINSINNIIASNRANVKHYTPFFISSRHEHSRKTHEHLQGSLLYDKDYRRYVPSGLLGSIQLQIKRYKMRTIQDVAFNDPYMFTAWNCKHFFSMVPIAQVINHTYTVPYVKNTKPLTYREYICKKYREELARLISIRDTLKSCPELDRDILRLRRLVKKWS